MIVVSNTSPITNLAAIGRLDLLKELFGTVLLATAVVDELHSCDKDQAGRVDAAHIPWIDVRTVADRALVASLLFDLDAGEAETIALAYETSADVVLIDERRGRHIAGRLGLKPLGLLGVLVLAKRRGDISEVKPVVDDLIRIAGFWISADLYSRVLREVSEF
jgi:predicted nucleic acid-binding protein